MRGWRSPRAARWSPVRVARQSVLGPRRGQSLALVLVAALVTSCTAFAPLYDRAVQQALVDTLLARTGVEERAVVVQSEAVVDAGGTTESWDPRRLQALVPRDVEARLGPSVLGRTAFVTPVAGEVPPTGSLAWRDGFCEHVRLLSGTCPARAGEIVVSEADVETFGLTVGSTATVAPAVEGPGVRLDVVGTYAPRDASWWQGLTLVGSSMVSDGPDPSAAHDAWLTSEATFVDAAVLPGETSQAGAVVPTAGTGVDELLLLGDRARDLARDARAEDGSVHVLTGLGEVTDDVRAQTRQAHRTVPLLMTPMALLLVFVLGLVLAAATEQRRGEVAVARLRGRSPAGAGGLLLVELIPLLLLGVVPGAVLALLGGDLARALLPGEAPFEAGPGFAVAVLVAVVAMVLTSVAAAVRVARQPLDVLVRSGRVPSRRWRLGALDAFVVAGVGTGVVAFATGSLTGSFALAGPALLALLVGLVLAQLVGPAASVVGRRLLGRGRLVLGVSLLETGRRRETRAVVAAITMASALAVFSLDADAIGARNRDNASRHDAGAPVVLRLGSRDLDGVREALGTADPTGRRATPVLVADSTLAVEPDAFRRIAFFPRGAPSGAQWRAIAPPDAAPVALTGSRFSLTVAADRDLTAEDIFGKRSEVSLNLVVTAGTGTRRTVSLGALPPAGRRTTLVGDDPACVAGCRLASVQLVAASGVEVQGDLGLSDLRVDGRPVAWGDSAQDWNTTQDDHTVIRPSGTSAPGVLRLALSVRGFYPAEVAPAWVPGVVPALLASGRDEPEDLVVTGVDGSERTARSAGQVVLVPSMPRRAALVDLDAISRGSDITFDATVEVWLVDDPELVTAVRTALREGGIAVSDVRRLSTIQQTYQDSVATWSLALGAVVGPAGILVALLVLLVLAATRRRDRARDLAVVRLNGADRRTTRRLAVWSQVPAVALAVVAGVGAGLAGAALAMSDVLFFPAPPTTPVADPTTSWPAVLVAAAACAVVLPAAALAGWAGARGAHLDRVRETV